jgi:hypothetical protein
MLPASTKGGGQLLGAPDVCKVPAPPAPPIPTPFPNIAMVNQASNTSTKVKFKGKQVVTKKSKISRSQGDEAGTLGGMISNVNMNEASFKKVSSKVKAQGQGVAHLTSVTGQNGSNANVPCGSQIAPSQTKVLVMP